MTTRSDRLLAISAPLAQGSLSLGYLQSIVDQALAVDPIPGNPDQIRAAGQRYQALATDADQARDDFNQNTRTIPDIWVSAAATNAQEVIFAGARAADQAATAMDAVARQLRSLGDDLEKAQSTYQNGTTTLQSLQNWLAGLANAETHVDISGGVKEAAGQVDSALGDMITGAAEAEYAGEQTAIVLSDYGDQVAMAGHLRSSGLTAADALMLGQAVQGEMADGVYLTPDQADAAAARLAGLSPTDQALVQGLLSAAEPKEQMLLLQALAVSGPEQHSITEIAQFDQDYRAHGGPSGFINLSNAYNNPRFRGPADGAAFVVVLRAQSDPIYAMTLAKASDGGSTFDQRLHDEVDRLRDDYGDGKKLNPDQLATALNTEVGGNYANVTAPTNPSTGGINPDTPAVVHALNHGHAVVAVSDPNAEQWVFVYHRTDQGIQISGGTLRTDVDGDPLWEPGGVTLPENGMSYQFSGLHVVMPAS
jgi:hypothetical protein